MAQKYYTTQDAAAIFGVSEDEVKKMVERRELHGYRDGANWKFKAEDIDRMQKDRAAAPPAMEEGDDVLLSEVALGQSDMGTSGTVIAMDAPGAGEGDIQLPGSGIEQVDAASTTPPPKKGLLDSKSSQFEELQLTLDEDLSLDDSTATLRSIPTPGGILDGGSAIDLSGKNIDDDDLVLGGAGPSKDVSIGGDSGISLLDPADSGLSLEQPLGLAASDSLELGEEDMLAAIDSPTQVKTDDEFLLTPMEDAADEGGESESGSQVIALDTESDEEGTMAGDGSLAAMLDEDLSPQPGLDMGRGSPLGAGAGLGAAGGLSDAAPLIQPAAMSAEAPYTPWQITGLVACALLLMLCGMMMYDLLRNMWSWSGPYNINSSLMDAILGLFEGK